MEKCFGVLSTESIRGYASKLCGLNRKDCLRVLGGIRAKVKQTTMALDQRSAP